jgi:hypothetical protein
MNVNKQIAKFMYQSEREYQNDWNELIPVIKEIFKHGYIDSYNIREALISCDIDLVWYAISQWMYDLQRWEQRALNDFKNEYTKNAKK